MLKKELVPREMIGDEENLYALVTVYELHLHSICSLTIKLAPSCLNLLADFRSCSIYSKIAPRILKLLHLHSICSLTIKVAPSCLNLLTDFRSCSIYSKIAPWILNLLHLYSLYLININFHQSFFNLLD